MAIEGGYETAHNQATSTGSDNNYTLLSRGASADESGPS